MDQLGHEAARTLLIRKAERPRDDSLRLETIITSRAAPRDVLVWSHQHEPVSVNRDEIRLIEPYHVERNTAPRCGLDKCSAGACASADQREPETQPVIDWRMISEHHTRHPHAGKCSGDIAQRIARNVRLRFRTDDRRLWIGIAIFDAVTFVFALPNEAIRRPASARAMSPSGPSA